jgi:KilA-N domain/Protein of unknown function (DUF3627)
MPLEIAFQQIKDNFWYGAYGPFRVVMMKDCGFVNASKLCKDGGKKYKEWLKNKSSKELIHEVELDVGIENSHGDISNSDNPMQIHTEARILASVCKSITTANITPEDKLISGTYCHRLLIPHIGSWVSAKFAVMVSKIVDAYIDYQHKEHIEDMNLQMELCTAAELKHKQAKAEADDQCEAAKLVAHQQMAQTQQLEKVVKAKKLQLDTWGNSHAFTMMRLNDNTKFSYYAIRRKRNNMSNAVKRLRKKHPNSIAVFQCINVPNPINLYNRLRISGVVEFKGNYCTTTIQEIDLITKLGELYSVV